MLKKIQWHENLTADEKIAMYKTVLDVLERAGGSMEFNNFMVSTCKRVDFSEVASENFLFGVCTIVQELIKRGYIRLELRNFSTSGFVGYLFPLVNVVRI